MDIGGNTPPLPLQTMKALFIYFALTCVAVNVAGNAMNNTAEGLKAAQEARSAQLCQVSAQYCS